MKKIIAVALLSAAFATPAFAEEMAAKAPVKKAPAAVYSHNMMHCDSEHAMHHGMMSGQGPDMMMEPDMHMLNALNLSDDQHARINKLTDELRHDNWTNQGLINDETAKLRDLYEADKRDPAAIGKEYQKLFDAKRQMIESYLNTQNRIEEVLTAEQRAQMKAFRSKMHQMHMHPMQ